jgi:hypothetical protein
VVHLTRPDRLSRGARLVIGLWSVGLYDLDEMADAMRLHPRFIDRVPVSGASYSKYIRAAAKLLRQREGFKLFAQAVMDSPEEIVQDSLQWGLPAWCATPLPEGAVVVCGVCRSKLNVVPCPSCSRKTFRFQGREMHPEDLRGCRPSKRVHPLPEPTRAIPGTPEKIAVLQGRLARGEQMFHPDDPVQEVQRYVSWAESLLL